MPVLPASDASHALSRASKHGLGAASSAKPKKTRSRNGCVECKKKRLKCDETRPVCLMCVKNDRKCGYSQEFRWSTKHERDLAAGASREPPSSFGSLLTAAEKVISDFGDGSQQAKHDLQVPVTLHTRPPPPFRQDEPQDAARRQQQQSLVQPSAAAPPILTTLDTTTGPQHDGTLSSPDLNLLSPSTHTLGLTTPSPEQYAVDEMLQDVVWAADPGFPVGSLGDVSLFPDSSGGHMSLMQHQHAMGMGPGHTPSPFSPQPRRAGGGGDLSLLSSFRANERFQQLGHPYSGSSSSSFSMMPFVPRPIMDRSMMLIEEWFRHVCSIWSCFDSAANPNRMIASNAWKNSEAVMNCMQSMAAICLSAQIPTLRAVAVASLRTGISCLKRDLKTASLQSSSSLGVPAELLLSLCCVGTAACWIDTKQLAAQFLREARALISRVNRATSANSRALSRQDAQAIAFFNNSIIYWDMLVAVVSDEEDRGLLQVKYEHNEQGQVVPHPWTGISAGAQRLFARAIRLCRRFRRHLRKDSISTGMALRTALRDISEAQEIEEELLSLEPLAPHQIVDIGDVLTPRAHLIDVAEGYRLASLLQLYQTFPDLVVRRLPHDSIEGDVVPWDRWIVPLALKLVGTLKKIPPDSGTRCIQPLLYLTASTGLKFDVEVAPAQPHQPQGAGLPPEEGMGRKDSLTGQTSAPPSGTELQGTSSSAAPGTAGMSSTSTSGGAEIPVGVGELDLDLSLDSTEPDAAGEVDLDMLQVQVMLPTLTKHSIDVSHARRFILERMSALEHSLPPAPVRVAKELVNAVWTAYDAEKPGMNHTHWIDVMEDLDLKTIFG